MAVETLQQLTMQWAGDMEFVEESDEQLTDAIVQGQVDRVRYAAETDVPAAIRRAADARFVYIATAAVSLFGRIELLWYVREQSLCVDYHRYGNLGFRADEIRGDVF